MESVMKNLPNELIFKICKMNRIQKQNDLYKKRMNIVIGQLDYYCMEEDVDNDGQGVDIECMFGIGSHWLRPDTRLLDDYELWGTSYEKIIAYSHFKDEDEPLLEYGYWCDNYY